MQRANGSLYVLPSQCDFLSELNAWTSKAGPETDTCCGQAILQREPYSARLFGVLWYWLSEVNEITSTGDGEQCLNVRHQSKWSLKPAAIPRAAWPNLPVQGWADPQWGTGPVIPCGLWKQRCYGHKPRPESAGCSSCAGREQQVSPASEQLTRMSKERTDGDRQTEEHQETQKILVSIIGSDLSIPEV